MNKRVFSVGRSIFLIVEKTLRISNSAKNLSKTLLGETLLILEASLQKLSRQPDYMTSLLFTKPGIDLSKKISEMNEVEEN